jgi:hypothetical protein
VRPVDEPPGADPHAGWCGEGRLEAGPYPIRPLGLHSAIQPTLNELMRLGVGFSERRNRCRHFGRHAALCRTSFT